jgi:signal peptidase II
MPLFVITIVLSFVASFAAKLLADAYLDGRVSLLGSFAGLQYSRNPGIAFGMRLPGGYQELLIIIALCFVIGLAWKTAHTKISRIGYGLIVGGAMGNVIDRLKDGFVTDFFQVGTFPIFNVADSCITIGVVFLLAESFGLGRHERS